MNSGLQRKRVVLIHCLLSEFRVVEAEQGQNQEGALEQL